MVTIKSQFKDIQTWLRLQETRFNLQTIEKFNSAIVFASKYYLNQKLYPTKLDLMKHVLSCADTVSNLNLFSDAVMATILYNVPSYCANWKNELSHLDKTTIELIEGIHKIIMIKQIGTLNDIEVNEDKNTHIEIIRNMILTMATDIRVVLIVLIIRGELMLNLKSCQDLEKQKKIANETLEIYSPLANRLGMWQVKWELEDLSLKYLFSEQYKKIANLLDETREERLDYIEKIKDLISEQIAKTNIPDFQISGRAKHIYSIWRKMKKKNYNFNDLYDIRAIRILVPEIKDCYTVLGIVHTQYSPIPGEFDDYISNPKPNNYQSVHTCVIGPEHKVIEIQIRTFSMHDNAEYGVAAHWRYKEVDDNGIDKNPKFTEKLAWLRQILDWREELIDRDDKIAELFKNEIFNDTIYVMTPKDRVVALPKNSTPIDFAYYLHSNLGHRCRGARIDGHIAPLSTILKNGQKVEILTVKEGGPSINWIHEDMVHSAKAIGHIRRYIRTQNNEEFYLNGMQILDREISKIHSNVRPNVLNLISKLGYENEKSLTVDLGKGELSVLKLKSTIKELVEDGNEKIKHIEKIDIEEEKPKLIKVGKKLSGILVDGVTGILTHLGKCCKPIPQDNIIGFISHGNGVAIHRANCIELNKLAKLYPGKIVSLEWSKNIDNSLFNCEIQILAIDRSGLLRDLTALFTSERLSIGGLKTICKNDRAKVTVTLKIPSNKFNYNLLVHKIQMVTGIIEVIRK